MRIVSHLMAWGLNFYSSQWFWPHSATAVIIATGNKNTQLPWLSIWMDGTSLDTVNAVVEICRRLLDVHEKSLALLASETQKWDGDFLQFLQWNLQDKKPRIHETGEIFELWTSTLVRTLRVLWLHAALRQNPKNRVWWIEISGQIGTIKAIINEK